MSLDLYAGSRARYYARDFETPQRRAARENGWNYRLVYEGDPPDWPSKAEAIARVSEFKERIFEKQGAKCPSIAVWNDSCSEYKAEQLFSEALNSLILVAAYERRPDLRRPKGAISDLDSDPAYAEAVSKGYYLGAIAVFEAHVFLPCKCNLLQFIDDPMGREQVVTTTENLRWALKHLASSVWSGQISPRMWFERGAALIGKSWSCDNEQIHVESMELNEETPAVDDILLRNAEYAFGVFSEMLSFSELHHVPIRQDA